MELIIIKNFSAKWGGGGGSFGDNMTNGFRLFTVRNAAL